MTFRQQRYLKCDGCEREDDLSNCTGWYSVQEIVTSPEQYEHLVRLAEDTGISGAISGDFCSLVCLASWAHNADTLRRME